MSKNIRFGVLCLLATLGLGACSNGVSHTQAVTTAAPVPQTATPTTYSIPANTLTSAVPTTTKPNEYVYVDPEGWYSVNIPDDWHVADSANSFVGKNGFFKTEYLPQMMFMRNALDVCQWLTNVDTKNTYAVFLTDTHRNSCRLTSVPEVIPASVLEVIENPSADFPQRFLYVKADAEHFERIAQTFTWLRPVNEEAKPAFQTASLRPEDISFWKNTSPFPAGFLVTEYKLPAELQIEDPAEKISLEFIPPEIRSAPVSPATPVQQENLAEIMKTFGYELRANTEAHLQDLYKAGKLVLNNIYNISDVYLLSSLEDKEFAFLAHTIKDPSQAFYVSGNATRYLVRNDNVNFWEVGPADPKTPQHPPIQIAQDLLLLGLSENTNVQVRNSRHDLIFSFATYFGTNIPVERFQAWSDHWILEVSDFVVQDGEILNQKFGFEEAFAWQLINDKPFYFFRKGPQIGISYAGQFLPMYYHEILHGYCCGLALNDPRVSENTIRFFGKRDGIWYYVAVEIN